MTAHYRLLIGLISLVFICTNCSVDEDVSLEEYISNFASNASQTESGLYYILERSTGSPTAMPSDFVQFHFRQFDLQRREIANSYDRDLATAFEVQNLLVGLAEGLALMGAGDKATFIVPADLSGGVISEGGLVYQIELLNVYESLEDYNSGVITDYLSDNNLMADRTESGLYYIITEPGEDPKPGPTTSVTVNYNGYFTNGVTFDQGANINFPLNGVIAGWTEGLQLIGQGGAITLLIPSYLAYGSTGNSEIPPNAPLLFDVELTTVN